MAMEISKKLWKQICLFWVKMKPPSLKLNPFLKNVPHNLRKAFLTALNPIIPSPVWLWLSSQLLTKYQPIVKRCDLHLQQRGTTLRNLLLSLHSCNNSLQTCCPTHRQLELLQDMNVGISISLASAAGFCVYISYVQPICLTGPIFMSLFLWGPHTEWLMTYFHFSKPTFSFQSYRKPSNGNQYGTFNHS